MAQQSTKIAPELINLTWEQFVKEYLPTRPTNSRNDGMIGYMFETHGQQMKFVNLQPYNNIFTLIDDGDGWYGIVSGLHRINRLGYFVTEISFPEDVVINIQLTD